AHPSDREQHLEEARVAPRGARTQRLRLSTGAAAWTLIARPSLRKPRIGVRKTRRHGPRFASRKTIARRSPGRIVIPRSTPPARKWSGVRSVPAGSDSLRVSVPRVHPLLSGQTVTEPVRASQRSAESAETRSESRGVPRDR